MGWGPLIQVQHFGCLEGGFVLILFLRGGLCACVSGIGECVKIETPENLGCPFSSSSSDPLGGRSQMTTECGDTTPRHSHPKQCPHCFQPKWALSFWLLLTPPQEEYPQNHTHTTCGNIHGLRPSVARLAVVLAAFF